MYTIIKKYFIVDQMEEILPKNENEKIDLEKLREIAKLASIYHQTRVEYERNKNLSHVVHASLHIFQFVRNHFNILY